MPSGGYATRREDEDLNAAGSIRAYAPGDFDSVSDICLRTAEAGRDATGLYVSDELMPDIFARPYLLFEPELAFVLEAGQRVVGYILGVADTARFVERYRAEWLPGFSRKYAHVRPPGTRDELIRHLGFVPERMLIPELDRYPAHLHIDLLPEFQRRGFGRALLQALVAALRQRGVPGLHLSMDPANVSARAFYDRLGFGELPSSKPEAPLLGIELLRELEDIGDNLKE
jgi:ribosomal protein S18 acetylase RimI-like enzyme